MKTPRSIAVVAVALTIGFLAARWTTAQPAAPAGKKPTTDVNMAMEQLESFVKYLSDTGQTNILERFNEYETASIIIRKSGEMGIKVHLLHALREGRTNDVMRIMEPQLAADAVGFVYSYRELPNSLREKVDFTAFNEAREYCSQYPIKNDELHFNEAVTNALKIMDGLFKK